MTAVTQFDTSEREIVVERLEVFRSGRSARGGAWHLFTVHANELDGTPITETLRSYDNLVGAVRVTIEPYVKDGVIVNYEVKRARTAEAARVRRSAARAALMGEPAPAAPAAPAPDLLARLDAAEQRLADLEGRFTLLAGLLGKDA
jgi:hypothetical protein